MLEINILMPLRNKPQWLWTPIHSKIARTKREQREAQMAIYFMLDKDLRYMVL